MEQRSAQSGARIMVVDDDADIANLIGEVLRDEGFVTRVVSDSRQALDAFREFQPDLATLDVMMPSVDGISLCLQLRTDSDVPILFLTAKRDPPDRVVGLRIGADDYMGKPFDNDELVARVEARLRRTRQPAAAAPSSSSCERSRWSPDASSAGAISSPACGATSPAATPVSSTSTSAGCARSFRTSASKTCRSRPRAASATASSRARPPRHKRPPDAGALPALGSPTGCLFREP